MADEDGVKKYSEKLFKKVKVSNYLKILITRYLSKQHILRLNTLNTQKLCLFQLILYKCYS